MVQHSGRPKRISLGAKMPDGTVYAGISPDTHQPMYVTPADAPLTNTFNTYTFNEANKYAKQLNARGHQDWRVPTKNELKVLFNNRAAIGGFDIVGLSTAGWYRSSTQDYGSNAWDQRFSDEFQFNIGKTIHASLRVVR
jgi:hypothetical protein